MRNWPFACARASDPKSAIVGKFDITVLSKGGDSGKNAACLSGRQLMISAYSKVPDDTADLVRYLCSAEIQKKQTIDWSLLPTRPALYSDPDVLAKYPFFKTMLDVLQCRTLLNPCQTFRPESRPCPCQQRKESAAIFKGGCIAVENESYTCEK